MTGTRDRILTAARELYWSRGYHATSPRAVLQSSGVGQGSLYHFFPTKADLGEAALAAAVEEALAQARADLADDGTPPLERIRRYLRRGRPALMGCPVGRHAGDPDIRADERLRAPVRRYFAELSGLLGATLGEAGIADAAPTADALVAIIQGAYVLAQGSDDPARFDSAIQGGLALLEAATARA